MVDYNMYCALAWLVGGFTACTLFTCVLLGNTNIPEVMREAWKAYLDARKSLIEARVTLAFRADEIDRLNRQIAQEREFHQAQREELKCEMLKLVDAARDVQKDRLG